MGIPPRNKTLDYRPDRQPVPASATAVVRCPCGPSAGLSSELISAAIRCFSVAGSTSDCRARTVWVSVSRQPVSLHARTSNRASCGIDSCIVEAFLRVADARCISASSRDITSRSLAVMSASARWLTSPPADRSSHRSVLVRTETRVVVRDWISRITDSMRS